MNIVHDFNFIVHLVSTFFMTGVIWVIQRVHYPSFAYIQEDKYAQFHNFHISRITPVVMIGMLIEMTTALLLFLNNAKSFPIILNLCFLVLIWMNTFFWNVPLHSKLSQKKDKKLIERLVISNIPRTLLWSLRSFLLVFLFFDFF